MLATRVGHTALIILLRISVYYQVAATVRDEATLERELHPLKMVKDNYPKTILSLDVAPVAYHNGIKIQNVLDWLLEQ